MARLFDDAQNEHLMVESPILTAYPFALACWFQSDNAGANQGLMWVGDKDQTNHWCALQARGNVAGDPIRFFVHNYGGASSREVDTSSGYSVNVWHHAVGLAVTVTDRRAFIDGGSKGTNADAGVDAMADHDRTTIGRITDSSPGGSLSGQVAMAAWYDLSNYPGATNSDKADSWENLVLPGLANGWSPLFFPLGLVAFHPLGGFDTEEADGGTGRDVVGGVDMAAVSDATGPGVADHPGGLIYPSTQLVFPAAAAAPAGDRKQYVLGGGILA